MCSVGGSGEQSAESDPERQTTGRLYALELVFHRKRWVAGEMSSRR